MRDLIFSGEKDLISEIQHSEMGADEAAAMAFAREQASLE